MSNYEVMRDKMQIKFLEYDQEKMIEKFQLCFDENYLYLDFMKRPYRINRRTGRTEWSEDNFQTAVAGNYNEAMTIYDVLCYSKEGCHLSGNFCSLGMLKGTVQLSGNRLDFFAKAAEYFQGKQDQLAKICEQFGEKLSWSGDVSYQIYPFSFLPITVQFWESDEEFSATLKFMVDENILEFMHYETIYLMISHILDRMVELL